MAHRSTWESPANHAESGRRNPYQNQIDCIIIRKEQKHTLDDSRAHNGLMTFKDHRLVRAKMNIQRPHIKKENKCERVNIEELEDPVTRAKFAVNVELKLMDAEDNLPTGQQMSAQDQWDIIVEASHKSAEETLGKRRNGIMENQKVRTLRKAEDDPPKDKCNK